MTAIELFEFEQFLPIRASHWYLVPCSSNTESDCVPAASPQIWEGHLECGAHVNVQGWECSRG